MEREVIDVLLPINHIAAPLFENRVVFVFVAPSEVAPRLYRVHLAEGRPLEKAATMNASSAASPRDLSSSIERMFCCTHHACAAEILSSWSRRTSARPAARTRAIFESVKGDNKKRACLLVSYLTLALVATQIALNAVQPCAEST